MSDAGKLSDLPQRGYFWSVLCADSKGFVRAASRLPGQTYKKIDVLALPKNVRREIESTMKREGFINLPNFIAMMNDGPNQPNVVVGWCDEAEWARMRSQEACLKEMFFDGQNDEKTPVAIWLPGLG